MRGPKTEKAVYSTCPYTAISRKVVGKSARDNPERYCGWFWVHSSTKKFERMAGEAMDICLRVLKEKKKAGSTAAVVRYSVMIISHITFRDCRVHFFGDNLSRNSCIHSLAWWDRITTCAFFETTYLILANLQAVAGGKKCCFRWQILAVTTW